MHDPDVVAFDIPRPWPKFRRPGRERDTLGRFRWPTLITVWHHEPGGADSGDVCRHYERTRQSDGTWKTRMLKGWRWHVHHWQIQIHPLQDLRRWLLTRCAWCHGRSRGDDRVCISHQWDGPRGRWWEGEPGLFHMDCSSIEHAHRSCVCDEPALERSRYGNCRTCGKFRAYDTKPVTIEAHRLLQAIPAGQRDRNVDKQVKALWAAHREREKASD